MQSALHLTRLWPGLASLWLEGRWTGLAVAAAFAAALNSALVLTFVWPQALFPDLPAWACPSVAWVSVLWFWIAGFRSSSRVPRMAKATAGVAETNEIEALYRAAQAEYLKGNWVEVEALLARLLARQADDGEALLLLATVHRRTGSLAKASKLLARLSESEHAQRWQLEIANERRRIEELKRIDAQHDEPQARAA